MFRLGYNTKLVKDFSVNTARNRLIQNCIIRERRVYIKLFTLKNLIRGKKVVLSRNYYI